MAFHLLWRSSFRFWLTRPWQLTMAILGTASGVAIMMSIDITARAAIASSYDAVRILSSEATHRIVGIGGELDESIYAMLRRSGSANLPMFPVVSGDLIWTQDDQKRTLRLIGRDLFTLQQAARGLESEIPSDLRRQLLTLPGAAVVTNDTAERLGWRVGEPMTFQAAMHDVELILLHTYLPPDELQNQVLRDVVIVDISTAQESLRNIGRLSSIDIHADTEDASALQHLANALPSNAHLLSISSQLDAGLQLTRAFSTNLRAMTALAMLLGVFLLFNAISYSVVVRISIFSLMRTLGVTNRQIFRFVLAESIFITCFGAIIGALVAVMLVGTFAPAITTTINEHFMPMSGLVVPIDVDTILIPIAIGLVVGAAAGAWPAYQAARVSPRKSGQATDRLFAANQRITRVAWYGVLLLVMGGLLLIQHDVNLWVSFAALFLLVLGYTLLLPRLAFVITSNMRRIFDGRGALAGLMTKHTHLYVGQYAVAIVVLTMAFGSASGLTWMVSSFRSSLNDWLEHALRADVYVSFDAQHAAGIENDQALMYLRQIESMVSIAGASIGRRTNVFTHAMPVDLLAIDLPQRGFEGYRLLSGINENVWQTFQDGSSVLISESLARRLRLKAGDLLPLRAADGWRNYRIAAIFQDYASASGFVVLSRTNYQQHWRDGLVTGMGIYLNDPSQANAIAQQIGELFSEQYASITTVQSLRDTSNEIFDQTFAFTRMMQFAIVLVTLIGLYTIVMSHQLERRKEFATLRMVGVTASGIGTIAFFEGIFIALFSYTLSWPLGAGIAHLLVTQINPRAFGWTMGLELPLGPWLAGGGIVLLIASTAALHPARSAARIAPFTAMRSE